MSSVARSCEVVAGKDNGGFCPEAGCRPVEQQVLTMPAATLRDRSSSATNGPG
ncbi:MAG: hypothetical protein H6837_19485 [Planctomycetes bacterium]|nr:hypothetical protein [Planctomycetota bacterium]